MATGYRTVEQAQAAYDTVLQQKQRQQRNDYINQQQAIMGVNNYLKQQGYNGGAAESILLRARGNRGDYSAYDAQLAELTALIQGMKSAAAAARSRQPDADLLTGRGSGKPAPLVHKPLTAGKTSHGPYTTNVRMTQ